MHSIHDGIGLRLEDVQTFLRVCDNSEQLPGAARQTFQQLFSGLGPHSTTVGQMARIAEFLFKGALPPRRGGYLELLFVETDDGLALSPAAEVLRNKFRLIVECCQSTREDVLKVAIPATKTIVRVGTPLTIGLRLLSCIFSDRAKVLSNDIELKVEFHNSAELLPRLGVGLLDCAIAFGPLSTSYDRELKMQFEPLGLETPMVLLCHPKGQVWLKTNIDANDGYWQSEVYWPESAIKDGKQRRAEYDDKGFRKLQLDELDLNRTSLILVPSWHQPEPLKRLFKENGPIQVSPRYDIAYSLVRMGMGVAVTTEIYSRQRGVTAFRLEPKEAYSRTIGVYFKTRTGLSPEAEKLMLVIHSYLEEFSEDLRKNTHPPSIGDRPFERWINALTGDGEKSNMARKAKRQRH